MIKSYFAILALCFFLVNSVYAADAMKAFPPAEKGMKRFVLQLDKKQNEADYQVQIIVGKKVNTDAVNNYFFVGKLNKETVKGWGYSYYKVAELGIMAGTLMGVAPEQPKVDRFISLGGQPYLVRYNSRLPIVIYAPLDAEVHYKIWSAGDEIAL